MNRKRAVALFLSTKNKQLLFFSESHLMRPGRAMVFHKPHIAARRFLTLIFSNLGNQKNVPCKIHFCHRRPA